MSRPHLHVLPGLGQDEPYVSFCGHCAAQPEPADVDTRVCTSCHLGLIVSAPLSIVPSKGEAFLMVDGKLGICAISLKAERLLGVSEADLVNRQLIEILSPADAEASSTEHLVSIIAHAARGDGAVHDVVVRPTGEWGIRWFTRIGPCAAPSAALIVLAPGG